MNNEVKGLEFQKGDLKENLCKGLDALGLQPSAVQVKQLCIYLEQLEKWNKVYNLTAIRQIDEMLVQHIFDCLAIVKPLQARFGSDVAVLDVGSGAGLPAVVIAILNPEWQVTALDAVHKKMAFVQQQITALKLSNLKALHKRIEDVTEDKFDLVVSRAFSSLADFTALTENVLSRDGIWCAMKGKQPTEEIDLLKRKVDVFHVEQLNVPQMDADRCLVWMKKLN